MTRTADAVARLLDNREHPPCWWCPRCGQLEAACGHPRQGPTGPPPLPPGRDGRSMRRQRDYLAALGKVTAPRSLP